jgi:hypothetical protein
MLAQVGQLPIFIHNSLHTYGHMIWEHREAYPYLRPGGLLFSDDALWNNAFEDFSREIHASQSRILHGVGFLRKD